MQGGSGQNFSGQLRVPGGTYPGQDTLPSQGLIPTHTHSDWDDVDTPFTSPAHLWDVRGNGRTQRKATQTWGERANSTQTVVPPEIDCFSLIDIITKQR